jgi:hypothetical protein
VIYNILYFLDNGWQMTVSLSAHTTDRSLAPGRSRGIHCSWRPSRIQRSRVRFPALPDFLISSGSGTGSIQPFEEKWGATRNESSGSCLENFNDRGGSAGLTKRATALYPPTSGGRSVGIVSLRTKGHRVCLFVCLFSRLFPFGLWRHLIWYTFRNKLLVPYSGQ